MKASKLSKQRSFLYMKTVRKLLANSVLFFTVAGVEVGKTK